MENLDPTTPPLPLKKKTRKKKKKERKKNKDGKRGICAASSARDRYLLFLFILPKIVAKKV